MELLNILNKDAVDFINSNGITMNYQVVRNKRIVTLNSNGEELGDFSIDGILNVDTLSMNIYIEDKPELRAKGLARLMIGYLAMCMMSAEPILKDTLIYIDADGSAGFWDHIGMSENRYYERFNRNVIGSGYEKVIKFSDLSLWALGVPLGYN